MRPHDDQGGRGQTSTGSFNWRRNAQKAASALRGILLGVDADGDLGTEELLFLDVWLRSQKHLRGGDIVDLLDLIGEVLRDGEISAQELVEARELIDTILEFGLDEADDSEARINQFLGFLLGITADDDVSQQEFERLRAWLAENPDLAEIWPVREITERTRQILEDGVVEPGELEELCDLAKSLCGQSYMDTDVVDGAVSEVFADQIDAFDFRGKRVCFIGRFVAGATAAVEAEATRVGAQVTYNVGSGLQVLVIGTEANRDWRFTSFGRKIETALMLKQNGTDLVILSERQWRSLIADL